MPMAESSKPKKKNKWILPVIIAALLAAVAVLAVLNKDSVMATLEGLGSEQVSVKMEGKQIATFDLPMVKSLPKSEFDDQIKKNGETAIAAKFGGVQLKDLLAKLGVSAQGYANISYKAVDGYSSAGTVAEVMQDGKVYVVYEKDGQPTKTRNEGGTGPLEIIIANEAFSLRNCKFLMEINIEK
jgi:hypothetical protein